MGTWRFFAYGPLFIFHLFSPTPIVLTFNFHNRKRIPTRAYKIQNLFGCWTAIAELLDNAIDEVKEQSFLSSFFVPLWHLLAEFGSTQENYGMHIKKIP
jgi:hypothetical protein